MRPAQDPVQIILAALWSGVKAFLLATFVVYLVMYFIFGPGVFTVSVF